MRKIFFLLTALAMGFFPIQAISETVTDVDCMETAAGFSLNCTANDISLSEVFEDDIVIIKGCDYPGDTTIFVATFTTVVNAKERHDIGIYFDTGGDLEGDGALTGSCSVSSLEYQPDPVWLDLDGLSDPLVGEHKASGVQDECGDIDSDHSPLYPEITITTKCVDDDGNGFLDLPYCTSWRPSGSNELCTGPLAETVLGGMSSGVTPGNSAKCKCDDTFNVPVPVPEAKLIVDKSANPSAINEPGASVTYTVTVDNQGVDPNNGVSLHTLNDDVYGDITSVQGDITATTCTDLPQRLDVNNPPYECTFDVDVVGNAGDEIPDIVTAIGTDDRNNEVDGKDDAKVTIVGVNPTLTLVKTANPKTVLEPGDFVDFTVKITNTSVSSDPVTIYSLVDSIHGDLNNVGTCSNSFTLDGAGGFYTCTFTEFVGTNAGDEETDKVTAKGRDDELKEVTASDTAIVTVGDVPSSITLDKEAVPTTVNEPGGLVAFSFTVTNTSKVDTVFITKLTDNTYATDLNGKGDCKLPQTLKPGEWFKCTASFEVLGDVGDLAENVATASGKDDDGNPVSAKDDATVNFRDVPPAAKLVKTVESAVVTYKVVVTNDSIAEELFLKALVDDPYGDVTTVQGDVTATTCNDLPQTLAKKGATGDSYTCTFDAVTTSTVTDTVTGEVYDNEDGVVKPSDSATVTFE